LDFGHAGRTAATAGTGTADDSTWGGLARRAACGCGSVLISAAAQDKCCAEDRAENKNLFHFMDARFLFVSYPMNPKKNKS
jgi:hypothetical protein